MHPGLLAAALAAALLIVVTLPFYLLREGQSEAPVAVVEPEPSPLPVAPREPEALPETRVVREPVEEPAQEAAPVPVPEETVLVAEETAEPPAIAEPDPLPEPVEVALVFPSAPLVYSPPGDAEPVLKRWRVPGVVRSGAGPDLRIQALAPDHTGLTAEPAPTLYWVLSGATDLRVELVVTDETSEEPLVDRAFDGAEAGIHALRLADLGVVLEPGVLYRWYATLVPDPEDRSSEVVSGGAIERVVPDDILAGRLDEAGPGGRAHVLAEAGLFYDAFDLLARWTAAHPEAAEPRRDRAALLEAAGLGKALPREGAGPG